MIKDILGVHNAWWSIGNIPNTSVAAHILGILLVGLELNIITISVTALIVGMAS